MLPFTGDTQNGANISFMIPYFNFIANRFSTLSKMASVHVNRFSRDRKTMYIHSYKAHLIFCCTADEYIFDAFA